MILLPDGTPANVEPIPAAPPVDRYEEIERERCRLLGETLVRFHEGAHLQMPGDD